MVESTAPANERRHGTSLSGHCPASGSFNFLSVTQSSFS